MLGRNQKNAGGKYHQTNDVYDYGNTGIDDKVIATTNAVVQLTLKQCSYKLPDTNSKIIFNETKGKILAVLGKDYNLVTHVTCLNAFYKSDNFKKFLNKSSSGYKCHYWNTGTAIKVVIILNDEVPITNDGDTGRMSIVGWNSIDGRSTFTFLLGMVRIECTNGMLFVDQTNMDHLEIKAKKSIGFDIDAIAGTFSKSLEAFDSNIEWLRKLANTPLSDLQVKNFLILLTLRSKKKDVTKENLNQTRFRFLYHLFLKYRDKKKMGSTAYALYNALTDDSTRPNQEWLDTKTCNNVSSGRTTDECQLQVIGRQRELEWLRAISVGYGKNLFFTSNDQYNNVDYRYAIK